MCDGVELIFMVQPTMGSIRDFRADTPAPKGAPDLVVVGSVLMGGLAVTGDVELADIAR